MNEIVFYLLWSNSDGLSIQNICEVPTKNNTRKINIFRELGNTVRIRSGTGTIFIVIQNNEISM